MQTFRKSFLKRSRQSTWQRSWHRRPRRSRRQRRERLRRRAQSARSPAAKTPKAGKVRLLLRQRQGRRQRHDEGAARRQGRQPRRDDAASACPCRPASPSPPRSAPTTTPTSSTYPAGARRPDRGRHRRSIERDHGHEVRRPEEPAARLRPLRRPRLDARHDGHDPQPRPQRRRPSTASSTATEQRALRLGQLPPLRADVRRRRAGRQKRHDEDHEPFERSSTTSSTSAITRDIDDTEADRRRPARSWSSASRSSSRSAPARTFPTIPWEQLEGAIGAVFGSWMNDRAIVYRRKYNIPHEWGTAVNVQAMVFGNMGDDSRHRRRLHPRPGHRREGLLRRVPDQRPGRGRRRRHPHARADRRAARRRCRSAYAELEKVRKTLEKHYNDVQDIEFTIQDGKLYMLQTRNGKRTGARRAASSPSTWSRRS